VNNQDLDIASTAFFVSCPCGDGLECIGTGINDIPLGELGTCELDEGKVDYTGIQPVQYDGLSHTV